MNILWAVLVLGVMGVLFGVLLTWTAKVFAVKSNPQRDAVREALPGANCGGCGYPGALAEGPGSPPPQAESPGAS